MEYVKLETEKDIINAKDFITKENVEKFIISDMKITQKDLDNLTKINDKKMLFDGIDFSGLEFGECNYSEVVFKNCNLSNSKMRNINTTNVIVEVDDCTGITTEQLTELKESGRDDLKFRVLEECQYDYDIEQFSAIISVMEEIKESIPPNSTDLEKFLFVYNVLGKNIVYDESGCEDNELYTEEAKKATRSLIGNLIKGRGVCRGYALAVSEVSKYVGLNAEAVGGMAFLSDGQSGGHAWNRVEIDGQWYYADLTWDYEHLDELDYCLKTEEEFSKGHQLGQNDKEQEEEEKSEIQSKTDDLFASLFGNDEEQTPTRIKRIYAAESYDPEIVKETMQRVNGWAELDNALARIDELKKNGKNLSIEQRADLTKQTEKVEGKFGIEDIKEAVSTVCLDNYKSVQQAIKEERDNNKEYDQTK